MKYIIPRKIKDLFWNLRLIFFPSSIRRAIQMLRVQKPVTKLLGPYYQQNHEQIEIEITYECNLRCVNCNRSCRQAPSSDAISMGQVEKLIQESIEQERKWKRITLFGGEPTLHPRILDIVDLLKEYKKEFSPLAEILLFTNGHGTLVNNMLDELSTREVSFVNTHKASPGNMFWPFNVAPVDLKTYRYADYCNACSLAEACGLTLNCYGYYFCGSAGGIDRVFGLDIGRKKMPCPGDMLIEQRRALCRYCGFFQRVDNKRTKEEKISPAWQKAYTNYKHERPTLAYY